MGPPLPTLYHIRLLIKITIISLLIFKYGRYILVWFHFIDVVCDTMAIRGSHAGGGVAQP